MKLVITATVQDGPESPFTKGMSVATYVRRLLKVMTGEGLDYSDEFIVTDPKTNEVVLHAKVTND